jgi:methyl-accepting chemotaxis protein
VPNKNIRESDLLFKDKFEQKNLEAEILINKLRYIFVIFFFISGISSYFSGSKYFVYVTIFTASILYLINTIFWHFVLERKIYSNRIKYFTTIIDLSIVFFVKFGFHLDPALGWGFAIKEAATFSVFFVFIILAGYRLDRKFSLLTGAYSVFLSILMIALGLISGEIYFTNDPSKTAEMGALRASSELGKILFLFGSSIVVSIQAQNTRTFLGRLSESDSKSSFNLKIMDDILSNTNEISVNLGEVMNELLTKSETLKNITIDQKSFIEMDSSQIDLFIQNGKKTSEIILEQISLTSNIKRGIESLNDTSSIIQKDGSESVNKAGQAKDLTEKSHHSLEATIKVVEEMKTQSSKIKEITTVISEIAESTNLLALNASIEAARAGEEGRGFSVVASEVQKLADKSIQSSKEINSILNATVKNIEKTSQMIFETSEKLKTVNIVVSENKTFLDDLIKKIHIQKSLSDEIKNEILTINNISNNISQMTENQKSNLIEMDDRNKNKIEMMKTSADLSIELEEITHRLGEHSNSLLLILQNRERIISIDKRKSHF